MVVSASESRFLRRGCPPGGCGSADDLNQHGPLRIKRIVVVERGRKWIATITYTEGE